MKNFPSREKTVSSAKAGNIGANKFAACALVNKGFDVMGDAKNHGGTELSKVFARKQGNKIHLHCCFFTLFILCNPRIYGQLKPLKNSVKKQSDPRHFGIFFTRTENSAAT